MLGCWRSAGTGIGLLLLLSSPCRAQPQAFPPVDIGGFDEAPAARRSMGTTTAAAPAPLTGRPQTYGTTAAPYDYPLAQPVTPPPTANVPPKTPIRRDTQPHDADKSASNAGGSAWKTLGVLAAIVGGLMCIGRLLRRRSPFRTPRLPEAAFAVLGRRQLDPQTVIHLVRIGERLLVLGSSAEGVRTLTEVDDPIEVERLAALCSGPAEVSRPGGAPLWSLFTGRELPAARRTAASHGPWSRDPGGAHAAMAEATTEAPGARHG